MGKLIFWFVIGLVILTVARIAARAGARSAQQQAREQAGQQQAGRGNAGNAGNGTKAGANNGRPTRPAAVQQAEQMVRCAHCGIHLPRSEAVLSAGETYCGQEHARLGTASTT
ncbi:MULTISPECIES: PP0621 family protein [unclassified Achromobacter]|uniref:PP0621 family protein n=1 Tax=unclassified Achromobacter TaxID=2626865 RepID=UPI000B51E314|nr:MULTISPECIES: PP0621 family protein [unclassified Achromobacter]OWT74705.1 hypothetical protein CEY05_19175 [Achromobacter sp. HZ34]OWT79172.1 hypothetical protein CEY04_09095 [Achromobacter sp. HZ28]